MRLSLLKTLSTSDFLLIFQVKQVLEKTSFLRNISITENCNVSDVSFGLSGVTLDNTFGFKISLQNLQKVKADVQV